MTKETETQVVQNLSTEDVQLLQGPQIDMDEILEKLTDLEKNYAKIIVTQNPKSKTEALKRAGSKADAKYLSKMAWEIEQRPHVKAYMDHLRSVVVEELGLSIQEVVSNARKAIEMAFELGKPKDADPHNRLLAELGGYIKNSSQAPQGNVAVKVENNLKGESVAADFKRFQEIAGV